MFASASSARAGRKWLWGGLILLWAVYLAAMLMLNIYTKVGNEDFEAYYSAGRAIAAGINPYNLPAQGLADQLYLYPPLTAIILAPVAANLTFQQAGLVWFVANALLLVLTVSVLGRNIENENVRALWYVLPIFFTPTMLALAHGQATVMMFALAAGTWIALHHEKPRLAGVLLALAIWVKVYPLIFLAYFIWKREFRVVTATVVAGFVVGVLQWVVVGTDSMTYYFSHVLTQLAGSGQPYLNYLNNSIFGFAAKLFVKTQYVQPLVENAALLTVVRAGISLLIVAVTVGLSSFPMSYARTSPHKRDFEYGLVVVASLLLASTLWESGMASFLLAYFLILRNVWFPRRSVIIALCVASYLIIDSHRLIWALLHERTVPALVLSTPFFGAVLLWALLAFLAGREASAEVTAVPRVKAPDLRLGSVERSK